MTSRASNGRKATLKRGNLGAALLLAALLAGCAAETLELQFVRPGQYDYQSCAEIAATTQNVTLREQELKGLTERAERDQFGVFVAVAAYRSDLLRAQGQLKLLGEAARNKNCPPQPPASAPSALAPVRR